MTLFGYHASHEQFGPRDLLALVRAAEAAGFDAAKSSDHFHPWSERHGQSGFAWSWLGAAMQATRLPFGCISAPGYRYHPAVLAQAAATVGAMFPGRFWLALGSGEALNEAIIGTAWPEKAERNARLAECFAVIGALLAGETVTHRGRIRVIEARLYSRPQQPVPLYGAAVSAETARFLGGLADGLLIAAGTPEDTGRVIEAFRANGGAGKPVILQTALSWAPTEAEALAQARAEWAHAVVAGEARWDVRRPADFDAIAAGATDAAIGQAVHVSASLDAHRDHIGALVALGADEIHLHNVGTNQQAFIEAFGRDVLPALRART